MPAGLCPDGAEHFVSLGEADGALHGVFWIDHRGKPVHENSLHKVRPGCNLWRRLGRLVVAGVGVGVRVELVAGVVGGTQLRILASSTARAWRVQRVALSLDRGRLQAWPRRGPDSRTCWQDMAREKLHAEAPLPAWAGGRGFNLLVVVAVAVPHGVAKLAVVSPAVITAPKTAAVAY